MSFEQQLREGLMGEGMIARWLNAKGWNVLPAYEVEVAHGKAPRFFTAEAGALVTPDMLTLRGAQIWWVEAKTKSAFTWHRLTGTWQTGIDRRHWYEYLKVAEVTTFPVWLLFLHKPGQVAKDTPPGMASPTGLYGEEIQALRQCIDHESELHGPSGMVYWRMDDLRVLDSYDRVAFALPPTPKRAPAATLYSETTGGRR
jgi:hypothetical protein